jgi:cell pole-organizing protein PopZ
MSDAKGQQNEPSMEEILASIRRIIAEDGETPAAGADPAASGEAPTAATAADPNAPDDILELTDVVEPDGTVVNLNATAAQEQRRAEPPPASPQVDEPHYEAADESLISAHTAAAAVGAFSQIAALRDESRPRDIGLGAGHLTLEAIVREELRPILRDWLDAHLPSMVERLVQQEIARLVGAVRR